MSDATRQARPTRGGRLMPRFLARYCVGCLPAPASCAAWWPVSALWLGLAAALWLLPGLVAAAVNPSEEARRLNDQGVKLFQASNYKEAFAAFKQAMNLAPDWAEPVYNMAMLMPKVNKPRDHRLGLEKAYKLEPNEPRYQEALVRLLRADLEAMKPNDPGRLDLQKRIIDIDPTVLDIGVEIAQHYYDTKKHGELRDLAQRLFDKNRRLLPRYDNAEIGRLYYLVAKADFDADLLADARVNADKATRYPADKPDIPKDLAKEIKKVQTDRAEGHLKLGQAAANKGRNDEAIAQFKKGLAILPDHEGLLAALRTCEGRGQAKVLFAEAMDALRGGYFIKARDLLEEVRYLQPDYPGAKEELDKCIEAENKVKDKIGRTSDLPRSPPDRMAMIENFIKFGQQYFDSGNQTDAKTEFEKALALIDLDPDMRKYRAQIDATMAKMAAVAGKEELYRNGVRAYESREWDTVVENLERLDEKYMPADERRAPDIPSYLAMAYWHKGDSEKAEKLAARQLNIDAGNNRAKFVLAHIYFANKQQETAFKYISEIREDDPNYPGIDEAYAKIATVSRAQWVIPLLVIGALLWLAYMIHAKLPEFNKNRSIRIGRSLLGKGMYREAIEELLKVRRSPLLTKEDGETISRLLAECYLKTATYDKATGECKHLLSIDPQDPQAKQWLGYAYLGRRSLSAESLPLLLLLFKTVEKERKNPALLQLLGEHFATSKQLGPEGVEVLEKWLEIEPNQPEAIRALGKFYLKKQRSDEPAMKLFERMMTLENLTDPEIILGVGKTHLRLGQYEECLKCCETVLAQDVNNELVHNLLRECYLKMERIDDLLNIYKTFLAQNPYNVAFQRGLQAAMKAAGSAGAAVAQPAAALTLERETPDAAVAQTGAAETGTIACPHCQAANNPTDYYCQSCGKSMAGE